MNNNESLGFFQLKYPVRKMATKVIGGHIVEYQKLLILLLAPESAKASKGKYKKEKSNKSTNVEKYLLKKLIVRN